MTPGILTRSGRMVTPDSGVPSLSDIAHSLAAMPRFAGHTRRPWTVAHHSLVVADLVERAYTGWGAMSRPERRAVALLHDAHEAVTSDVPTPFKTLEIRLVQRAIDIRIMDAYAPGGYESIGEALRKDVEHADHEALLAEAYVVGPPTLETPEDVRTYFGGLPSDVAIQTVGRVMDHEGDVGTFWLECVRRCNGW